MNTNINTPVLSIDIGYSYTKYMYQGKVNKIPTSISLASDNGLSYGENNVYDFEGDKYFIGETNSTTTFSTTEYKMLYKFAPVIIYHLRKVLGIDDDENIIVNTGLSLVDWKHKNDFLKRISLSEVNGIKTIQTIKKIIPQGVGSFLLFSKENNNVIVDKVALIDIGFYTVNFIFVENGKISRNNCNGYPSAGMVSIIRGFTNYLSNTYAMQFTEQDASKIFHKGHFTYNGETQEKVAAEIVNLKRQFIQKLMSSVLINDKKLLTTSDIVLLCGGGTYLLNGVVLPPHYRILPEAEYSNVRGYALA